MERTFEEPRDISGEEVAVPYNPEPERLTGIAAAVRKHERKLLAIDGVEGLAAGQNGDGDDAIVVYTRDGSVAERLPETIADYPVAVVVTGEIRTY